MMCSELMCPLCDISSFADIETFKVNLIKVNSKPIKCPLCSEVLLGLDKLTIHLFGHSLPFEREVVKPTLLQEETPPKTQKKSPVVEQQQYQHPQQQQQLQSSTKSVTMTSSSQSSSSLMTTRTDESFRCEICGFVFEEEHLLSLHLNLVHNFTPNSSASSSGETLQSDALDPNKRWSCHLCNKHFKMKGALRIHVRVAHVRFHDQNQRQINIADYLRNQKSVDMCTKQTEMLSLTDPYSPQNSPHYSGVPSPVGVTRSPLHQDSQSTSVAAKNQKIFQCEECKKTFTTKYFLKKHRRLHTGEYPYRCEVEGCGKMFHFQQSYHKHLLYHSDAKPYECSECGRSFKELSTLNNHQRIHSGVKPFGCHVCGKFFRQKVSYLVHQRIHNGALPYKCSECGKGFRYKVSQRSHKCNGTIERQPGTLIQKLMQNSSILPVSGVALSANAVTNETALATPPPTSTNISISNQNQHETTAAVANTTVVSEHELCLEELLKESYDKLMKATNENESQVLPQLTDNGSFMTHAAVAAATNNNDLTELTFENSMAINSNYIHHHHHHHIHNSSYGGAAFHSTPLETINEDSIKDLLYGG